MDDLDREILNLVQKNAKMKLPEMSKKLKKPETTVFERIKRMEKAGVIKGYTAMLDPSKVERGFVAFMLGRARLGADADFDALAAKLAAIPGVTEVHFVTGEWDYILKIRVRDEKEYYEVAGKIARSGIDRGKGMIVPKTFKEESRIDL